MISHLELKLKRRMPDCPPLAGESFAITLTAGGGPQNATVEIADDLSYTIKTPGAPDQTGQLTKRSDFRYKYDEAGPPAVSGSLICFNGVWSFHDELPGTEAGTLTPVS